MNYQLLLDEIKAIAVLQGELAEKALKSPASVDFLHKSEKGHTDLDPVTALDKHIEREFYVRLSEKFPELGFFLEEHPELNDTSKEHICYIDPIDGTKYFAKDIPLFCTMVGVTRGGEPVLGVTYNPISGQLYAAAEGIPATINGKPISVSAEKDLTNAILSLDMVTHREHWEIEKEWINQKMVELNNAAKRIRLFGAGGLSCAWVASGGLDGYVDMWGHKGKIFDIVAGKALIKYAGGKVLDLKIPGLAEPRFIGGNQEIVDRVSEVLLS